MIGSLALAWPWGLLALGAVPVLVALYFLRRRSVRRPVSSLLLWREESRRPARGRRVDRLKTPLRFWLELLALLLLATAAAGPLVLRESRARPLVVVLDDSWSMRAGGQDSPRERALEAILEEAKGDRHREVRVFRAAESLELLGEAEHGDWKALAALLDRWRPSSPVFQAEEAVAAGLSSASASARILVVTDHSPEIEPRGGRVRIWSFGRPAPNLAFVDASRGEGRGGTGYGALRGRQFRARPPGGGSRDRSRRRRLRVGPPCSGSRRDLGRRALGAAR